MARRRRKSAKERKSIARGLKTFWDKKGRKGKKNSKARKLALGVLAAGAIGGAGILVKNRNKKSSIAATSKSQVASYLTEEGGQMALNLGVPSSPKQTPVIPLTKKIQSKQGSQLQLLRKRRKSDPKGGSDFVATKKASPVTPKRTLNTKEASKRVVKASTSHRKKGQPRVDMTAAQTPPKTRAERNARRRKILKSENVRSARQEVKRVQDLIGSGGGSQSALEQAVKNLKRKKAARKGRVTKAKNRGTFFSQEQEHLQGNTNMFIGNIEQEKIEFGRGKDKKKRKSRAKRVGAALAGAAAVGAGVANRKKIGKAVGAAGRLGRDVAIAGEAKARQSLRKGASAANSTALRAAGAAGKATGSLRNTAGDVKRAAGVGQKSASLNRRFGKSRLESAKAGLKDAGRSLKNKRSKRKRITG